MARKIYIGLFVWEVIDEAMGIDGDINTVDADGRTRKVIRLDCCDGHRRKVFLINKRECGMHK